ncbi:hypothetical protein EPUS_04974 [Endocarpon pusillum Z07020]|uniref:Endo-1,3(4)-beta-glucanase 1 carbohydrate binding domain-containing protein n=1 Tax=Endocarpon pusillum (strain Z07020 / HMAS-L-300199) TaxID=1263415 RepID=U1GJP8_ENDPU|nr:uncharacterized protein EPUS_04974 [Endocarpon pusillum Z07020]ERF72056.1 hypothetical protein EPUS_04974 [Endocarpon pusillum Z07020]
MGYSTIWRKASSLWWLFLFTVECTCWAPFENPDLTDPQSTCFGDILCPFVDGIPTLRCDRACYQYERYACTDGRLLALDPPNPDSFAPRCPNQATSLHLSDPPYENYFYSDCNVDAQVVVTTPLQTSDLSIISPRLVIAWPAGNSGACAFFEPQDGKNGSLGIELVSKATGSDLSPVYVTNFLSKYPSVGVEGILHFNSSAFLTLSILGSVRTIRDFTEGPSILPPIIQDATSLQSTKNGGVSLSRLWLDNETRITLSFSPHGNGTITVEEDQVSFNPGIYTFSAHLNYPQLEQLTPQEVFNPASQELATQMSDEATSLAFLSYTEKLLAGAWRFLTYFGRDSMISALLLQPVLSEGNGGAIEAVIGAVLERINKTDGTACHEETIGDYATYLNLVEKNISSTQPIFDYNMVDTDYFLPVLMQRYFLGSPMGMLRSRELLAREAGAIDSTNRGLRYGDLARLNAEKIMDNAAPFAAPGGQVKENMIRLKEDTVVGQWRDSTYGSGGGRIPYDVNTALVPAALRAIAAISRFDPSIYAGHDDWADLADEYAQVWEDETLPLFQVTIPADEARNRLESFVSTSEYYNGPSHADSIDSDVIFHGLALEGNNDIPLVDVMNTDDCFRLFLLNTTNEAQLTLFLNQSALNVLRPFPAGLMTSVGVVVANPALGEEEILRTNFTNNAYHGTVVWSWQLAMIARGLETQLARCNDDKAPAFCADSKVYGNVKLAYNTLWDNLEANRETLSQEVWSWRYMDNDFQFTPLGSLPPPPGVGGGTESNIRQLWSLTFLAVKRNEAFK